MRRHLLVAAVFLLAACTPACGAHGRGSGIPDGLEQYEENSEIRRYTGVAIAGIELWQTTPRNVCCDQESSIDVYGFDAQGHAVSSLELVRRLGDRPAADLVAPVSEILLHQPHRALAPGDPGVNDQFISDAERPLIAAPVLADGVLTYFVLWGSMAPQLVRIRVTLATGDVVRDWTRQLVAPPPEPPEVVLRRDPDVGRIADLDAILAHATDAQVREGAVRALAAIGTPEAVAVVRRVASSASVAEAQRFYSILQAAGAR